MHIENDVNKKTTGKCENDEEKEDQNLVESDNWLLDVS